MLRTLVVFVLTLGVSATAAAQEQAKKPQGPPPEFVTVAAMDKPQALLELEYTVVIGVQRMRVQSEYEVKGETRTVEIISPKPLYKQRVMKLKLKYADVTDARGKKLETEEVWKRLAVGDAVVIPVDGKAVDAAYLRALAPDTLVIVSPQCAEWRRQIPFEGKITETPYKGPTDLEKQLEDVPRGLPD